MQAVPDYESLGGGGVEEEEGRKKNKIYQHYTCRGDTIVAASNGSAANTECGSVYIYIDDTLTMLCMRKQRLFDT